MVVAAWANALWFAGDNPRALEAGSRAVALAVAAECHLGLGKLRRTRNPRVAREHFTTATTMFHQMGMRFPQQRAEEESKKLL